MPYVDSRVVVNDSVKFNTQTGELVFSGGLQQYLIREARKQKDQQYLQQPRQCDGSSPFLTFHDLAVFKFMNIFCIILNW